MPDVSRRAMLRGVTFAGAACVGGASGVGTYAYFTDGEVFNANSIGSGSLDLEIAVRTESGSAISYAPEQDGSFPSTFVSDSTITVEFPTVDPTMDQAAGSTTVAFRLCDNPGRVWLRPTDEESSGLADAVDVTATYAPECGDAGHVFYNGSLAGLFDVYADGVRLGATDCPKLGKVELQEDPLEFVVEETGDTLAVDDVPGTLRLDGPEGPVTLEITGLHWNDDGDEVRGVDLATDEFEFCRVDVKGGRSPDEGPVSYWPGCTDSATEMLAGTNAADNPSGLSHFVVHQCAGDETCVECEPACVTLDWSLQNPSAAAGESLSFNLELLAEQCRNTEPSNPWL